MPTSNQSSEDSHVPCSRTERQTETAAKVGSDLDGQPGLVGDVGRQGLRKKVQRVSNGVTQDDTLGACSRG